MVTESALVGWRRVRLPTRFRAVTLAALSVTAVAVTASPSRVVAEPASEPSSPAAGRLDVGRYHACTVIPGGRVRCWGYGNDGALGYATRANVGDDETPATTGPVDLGAGRTATALSAGAVHTCAIRDDGAVQCWGFGGDGRLGHGNTTTIGDDETPGSVDPVDLGPGRTAKAISAGRAHTCAVLDDGVVRCWGFGFDGRLGYGNNVANSSNLIGDDETPASVAPVDVGAGRTATTIAAGDSHTCALLDGGSVRCWGFAGNGQLGYANTDSIGDDETPGSVGPVKLGAGRRAVAITAGNFHTCALLDDGTVRCWGFGGNGRLGYASTQVVGDDETPDAVGPVDLGPGRTATAITAGADHTCAVLDNGSVRCWGLGANGALGYANTASIGDNETPAAAGPVDLGPGRRAVAISAGGNVTCATLDDGSSRCWGKGPNGELGDCTRGTIGDDEAPGSLGPIDLGVPNTAGAGCRPAPPPVGASAEPSPAATAEPQAPGAVPPAAAPAAGGGSTPAPVTADPRTEEARRLAALRACRVAVDRRARQERSRVPASRRGRAVEARRRAHRLIGRRAAAGRRGCLTRFGRTPGRVATLSARGTAGGSIVLEFAAPGSDGVRPPAARGFLVRQSLRPIRSARDFARAQTLCSGTCRFPAVKLGGRLTLRVTHLRRRRTYSFAVVARDNVSGRLGPRSRTIHATTR